MPRNASGIYSKPAGTTAISGATASSASYNSLADDLGSEITASLPRDGAAAMSGDLQMGGNQITGIANGVAATDAAAYGQITALSTTYQPLDAQLTDIAGLTPTDGNFIVGDGVNFIVENGATARASLGLAIGTDVQAWANNLDDIAALTPTKGNLMVGNGTDWVAVGVGADDTVLTADTAEASGAKWAAPAATGTWTLLNETSISAAASHGVGSITNREVWIELINVLPDTANADLLLRTGVGTADSGASDYAWTSFSHRSGGSDNSSSDADTGIQLTSDGTSDDPNTTAPGVYGDIFIKDFNQAVQCMVKSDVAYRREITSYLVSTNCAGVRLDSTARDFVQILFSGGVNIASGIIRVWGK